MDIKLFEWGSWNMGLAFYTHSSPEWALMLPWRV